MEMTSKKRLFDEVEDGVDCLKAINPVDFKEIGDLEEDSTCLLNEQYEQSLFDSEDPFNPNPSVSKSQYSFVRNGKRFDFQEDHGCLSDLFDIRLSTDTITNCHPKTQETYDVYRNEQYGDTYLKSHEGAVAFLNSALNSKSSLTSDVPNCLYIVLEVFADVSLSSMKAETYG
ncbi:hypothetical protein INT47_002100 [Mucor saturninus]|uniref:Uncharacterized protein n=1 Tax=Mucor saturninus TaxID=64648 RepID=A0A8H7R1S5_9FUNG|nr:hypothetical protein INT47_002100 [Mucor saturninus]